MKGFLLMTLLVMSLITANAQEDKTGWYDFWVGKWDVSWDEPDGKKGRGINHIVKILDGKVIQENFSVLEGVSKGYLGTSISVLNPNANQWHQGYADNQGSYFNLIGEKDGDKYIFKTEPITRADGVIIQRMVFYNIMNDTLTWDWESTKDGGKNWTLNWRIMYKRVKEDIGG